MALTHKTLPNFDGLTALLAVALAINFIMLINMEYPYSLCCRPKFCFRSAQSHITRGFELPEPLFAFPTPSIVCNFLSKFVFHVARNIHISITSELEVRKPDCKDIMAVVSKKKARANIWGSSGLIGSCKTFL